MSAFDDGLRIGLNLDLIRLKSLLILILNIIRDRSTDMRLPLVVLSRDMKASSCCGGGDELGEA
jgi:hypothetical protein